MAVTRRGGARFAIATVLAMAGVAIVVLGDSPGTLGGGITDRVIMVAATIAMAVVSGAAVLNPTAGLVLWLVCMPILNLARVQLVAGSLAMTSSTIVVVAIGVGLAWDARSTTSANSAPRLDRTDSMRMSIGAIGIAVIACLSILASQAAAGWPVVIHGVLEPVAAAVIVVALRPSVARIVQILAAVVASASLAAVLAIYRLSRVAQTLDQAQSARGDFGHFIFYNVNIFGEILALAAPIALAGLLLGPTRRGRWVRGVSAVFWLLLLVALYFTYSKGAWLGSLAGMGLVGFVVARSRLQRAGVATAVALISLLIVPLPVYVAGFVAGLQSPGATAVTVPTPASSPGPSAPADAGGLIGTYTGILETLQGSNRLSSWDPSSASGEVSVHERLLAWRAAISMAVQRPLLGVGAGQFGPQQATSFRQPGATRDLNSAHNYILNIAAELGIVVALVVVGSLIAALRHARRAYRSGGSLARMAGLAIAGALVAFVVMGETTGVDLYAAYRVMNSDGILFAIVVGAGLALSIKSSGTSASAS